MNTVWKVRLAEPEDAPAFAEWVAAGVAAGLIDSADVEDTKRNPTTLYFVVTKDGIPVAFAPCYLVTMLAHLGFSPQSSGKDRLRALEALIEGVSEFVSAKMNIREIQTLTKTEYPIGAWALKHGFKKDGRELFRLAFFLEDAEKEAVELAMKEPLQ